MKREEKDIKDGTMKMTELKNGEGKNECKEKNKQ